MNKIYINKINLSNIACFDTFEIELGKITRVTGQNGTGKTTLIKGLSAGINAGNPIEIIRNGETKGEVAIEFSNGMTLEKIINTAGSARIVLKDDKGHTIPKPQTFINQLIDAYSFNPISILTATPKERIKLLLEALPMKADIEDFRPIFGELVDTFHFKNLLEQHALDALQTCYTNLYDKRTAVNAQVKSSKATIESLRTTLPVTRFENIDFELNILTNKHDELATESVERISQLNEWLNKMNNSVYEEYQKKLDELNAWKSQELENLKGTHSKAVEAINDKYKPEIDRISLQRGILLEQLKNKAAYDNQLQIINEQEEYFQKLSKEALQLTDGLNKLESLKSKFLANIPIQGLNVQNGIIYYNSIEFDSLNTQQQIEIAVEIAKLRAGELGIVFVDGFERLDSQHQQHFIEAFNKTDLQLLVTEVSNTDLKINYESQLTEGI